MRDPRSDAKLIGRNYRTSDLMAKVTGRAKYAEDYRAEGMLFCKLLLSPMPHARVRHIDMRDALRMPGVRAILTADDVPPPADGIDDNGNAVRASKWSERALTMEPLYCGEPVLAVAAVDESTAVEGIERLTVDFEPLPFIDPLDTLRPRTGSILWKTNLGGQITMAPLTFEADGDQYVSAISGNVLVTLGLRKTQ